MDDFDRMTNTLATDNLLHLENGQKNTLGARLKEFGNLQSFRKVTLDDYKIKNMKWKMEKIGRGESINHAKHRQLSENILNLEIGRRNGDKNKLNVNPKHSLKAMKTDK